MLSHTRMGVPYEYTHMGRPIRVWDNIRIWGRTCSRDTLSNFQNGGSSVHTQGISVAQL